MLHLRLDEPEGGPLRLLVVGAHPDDIEIGAGGMLATLAGTRPGLRADYVVLTGTPERRLEAQEAARAFLPGCETVVHLHDLPEGRLPSVWDGVKDLLEELARSSPPDLVLSPSSGDAHQDHRTIGEIVPTVFRDALHLAYEIPKWDGDLGRPNVYLPLTAEEARHKVELLHKCYPSQHGRDWWDDEVFLGLARLRGVECRAPYAEGFTCTKAALLPR